MFLIRRYAADLETIIASCGSCEELQTLRWPLIRLWFVACLITQVRSLRSQWMSLAAAVGGGGRYDEMIGKFTGQNTSACGFSIGFERIVMLLLERGYEIPDKRS